MASRIQQLVMGLGKAKQPNISTISASFLRFKKNNPTVTSTGFATENDATEVGKGNEFISAAGVFPVSYSPANSLSKYCSSEFMVWCAAFGLGNIVESPTNTYTITPIDPGVTLELPYFSVVEQIAEGGGSAIDNAFLGAALEDWTLAFNYGPGRQSASLTANWVGSGLITSPSGVTVPATLAEHYMLGASMALTVNGVDYVAGGKILSGSVTWKNNILLGPGFFPGSGLQNGAAVRGRLEIGPRAPGFEFTTRLYSTSTEYAKLIAQTTGTAVLTLTFNSANTVTITFPSISYEVVENTEADGLVACRVMVAPKFDPTNGVMSIVAKCPVTEIGQ